MKNFLALLLFFCSAGFGVTNNQVWRIPNGTTLPAWGPVRLSDNTNAVTGQLPRANLPTIGQQISSSTTTFSTSSTSYVDVTNATVTITTTGRPVVIGFVSDGSGNDSFLMANSSNTGTALPDINFKLLEGSTTIGSYQLRSSSYAFIVNGNTMWPVSSLNHFYVPAAGTYTYKLQAKGNNAVSSAYVSYAKMYAYELMGN